MNLRQHRTALSKEQQTTYQVDGEYPLTAKFDVA
jgi:hypothetical protein